MMKKILIIIVTCTFIAGCSKGPSFDPAEIMNHLKTYTEKAIKGDKESNELLGGLIDQSIPVNNNFEKLTIDKIELEKDVKLYYVMLQYANPVYNRFAIYDSAYTPLLIDKSLNGELNYEQIMIGSRKFVRMIERFVSKDILTVKRLSIYSLDAKPRLAFRTFIGLTNPPDLFLSQELTYLSQDTIMTSINAPIKAQPEDSVDQFIFDKFLGKYISKNNYFDRLLKSQVDAIESVSVLPEITDEESVNRLFGKASEAPKKDSLGYKNNSFGFMLNIPEDWKKIENTNISHRLKKSARVSLLMNNYLGASITVLRVPDGENYSDYIDYDLKNEQTQGKYSIQFSNEIPYKKNILIVYKISCGNRTFILLLEAMPSTLEEARGILTSAVKSFQTEC